MKWVNQFLPIFHYVTDRIVDPEAITCSEFRAQLMDKITLLQEGCLSLHGQDEVDTALFSVCVWTDEQILRSTLPWKKEWQNTLLQSHYFRTSIGGSLFFEKLEACEDVSMIRLYLLCLSLGFCGKYISENNPDRMMVIEKARLSLPHLWQNWPCDSAITPLPAPAEPEKFSLFRIKIKGWLWLPFVSMTSWLLLFVTGMVLTL